MKATILALCLVGATGFGYFSADVCGTTCEAYPYLDGAGDYLQHYDCPSDYYPADGGCPIAVHTEFWDEFSTCSEYCQALGRYGSGAPSSYCVMGYDSSNNHCGDDVVKTSDLDCDQNVHEAGVSHLAHVKCVCCPH